jgi:trigger factor
LAGKPVIFEVKVREVAESLLPEVNEDFVRQLGVDDGKVETLNERVRDNLEREMKQRLRTLLRTRVFDALVAANKFELPQSLLKAEIEYVRRLHHALRGNQMPVTTDTPEESTAYERAARSRLMRSLILAEVIRVNEIKASPERVRARITELSQEYQSPEEFVRACYANRERMQEIEAAIVDEQAIEHLLQTAEVTEKPVTFQELVHLVSTTG